MAEFKKPYDKASGFWHVATEGDCEGRSTTDLGVSEGAINMTEFDKPYNKAYGFWHVTTEGDCEGRSTTDLGVFEGNIDTIALALAARCYYYAVFVRDGNRADTFIISTKQESLEERRQKVLDKLTAEERKLLGV